MRSLDLPAGVCGKRHYLGLSFYNNEMSDLKASAAKLLTMIKADLAKFRYKLSGKVAEIEKSTQFVSNKYNEVNLATSSALETSKKLQEENLKQATYGILNTFLRTFPGHFQDNL